MNCKVYDFDEHAQKLNKQKEIKNLTIKSLENSITQLRQYSFYYPCVLQVIQDLNDCREYLTKGKQIL